MTLRAAFEPEATAELEAAALWYEAQQVGLGLRLLAAVDRTVEHAGRWPDTGSPVEQVPMELGVRRLPATPFPYHVIYLVANDALRVLAVAHDRRRPGYWQRRY